MTIPEYAESHVLDHDDGEPIRVEARLRISDYVALSTYVALNTNKLISFFRDHLVDDEYQPFVLDFYKYACEADKDGPAFEEWRVS